MVLALGSVFSPLPVNSNLTGGLTGGIVVALSFTLGVEAKLIVAFTLLSAGAAPSLSEIKGMDGLKSEAQGGTALTDEPFAD